MDGNIYKWHGTFNNSFWPLFTWAPICARTRESKSCECTQTRLQKWLLICFDETWLSCAPTGPRPGIGPPHACWRTLPQSSLFRVTTECSHVTSCLTWLLADHKKCLLILVRGLNVTCQQNQICTLVHSSFCCNRMLAQATRLVGWLRALEA